MPLIASGMLRLMIPIRVGGTPLLGSSGNTGKSSAAKSGMHNLRTQGVNELEQSDWPHFAVHYSL